MTAVEPNRKTPNRPYITQVCWRENGIEYAKTVADQTALAQRDTVRDLRIRYSKFELFGLSVFEVDADGNKHSRMTQEDEGRGVKPWHREESA